MTKPSVLPVHVDRIPEALKRERRWANWLHKLDDKGRWTKMPTGKSNDPSTWVSFEHACHRYQRGGLDGLLFALGDGWSGGDLDHCCAGGVPTYPGAAAIIERFGCYCEVSPSGTGFKLFFRAVRIGFQLDFSTMQFTPWRGARWFAVTGHGSGDPTVDGTAALEFTLPEEPDTYPAGPREGFPDADVTSDDDLLLLMVGNVKNGDAVLALWRGEKAAHGDDHSAADMALLRHLAFWTNYDVERIDRLFRLSGLMRTHWESASYRRASLTKALQ